MRAGFAFVAAVVVPSKCGDFYDLSAKAHVHDAKTSAYDSGVAKQLVYRLGCRIGCNIEVFWVVAQHQVANGPANEVALIATTA